MAIDRVETWQLKTLDEVCDFSRGLTYSKKDEVVVSKNIVLRANNINLESNSLNLDELKYISNDIQTSNDKKVKTNSILICISSGSKSHLGKVALIDKDYDFAFGGFMGLITPRENILPKFLYRVLTSSDYKKFINNLTDGANINNLKWSDLQQFKFELPNLKEQERIVGILDEAFAGIDVLRQNAVSNLNNAKELFDSYLDQTFTQNTETWQLQPLKNLASIKDGDWIEKKDQSPSGIRLIQTGNVGNGFFKDKFENARYISENTFKELNCTEIFPDDCLISRLPDPVGRACIVPNLNTKMITAVDCSIVKFDLSKINPKFFIYYAMSAKYYAKIKSLTTGSTRERISRKNLETITIPLPNLKAQEQIVSNLNIIHEQSKELQSVYERKITLLDELKQSLLQKAFRGEL